MIIGEIPWHNAASSPFFYTSSRQPCLHAGWYHERLRATTSALHPVAALAAIQNEAYMVVWAIAACPVVCPIEDTGSAVAWRNLSAPPAPYHEEGLAAKGNLMPCVTTSSSVGYPSLIHSPFSDGGVCSLSLVCSTGEGLEGIATSSSSWLEAIGESWSGAAGEAGGTCRLLGFCFLLGGGGSFHRVFFIISSSSSSAYLSNILRPDAGSCGYTALHFKAWFQAWVY